MLHLDFKLIWIENESKKTIIFHLNMWITYCIDWSALQSQSIAQVFLSDTLADAHRTILNFFSIFLFILSFCPNFNSNNCFSLTFYFARLFKFSSFFCSRISSNFSFHFESNYWKVFQFSATCFHLLSKWQDRNKNIKQNKKPKTKR